MPPTRLLYYRDTSGAVPVLAWLLELRRRNPLAFTKCLVKIRRLAALGYEIRRPESDLLRDGIYELRTHAGRVQYRILYFFHGRDLAILAHAITKEGRVPAVEIDRAVQRKRELERAPDRHTSDVGDFTRAQEERTQEESEET